VIGTGRAADRQKVLDFGAQEFVDSKTTRWKTSGAWIWFSMSSVMILRNAPRVWCEPEEC